ncbi:MAG TPA: dihydrofolate reductase family protein [Candidatus Saccharimonadales bacterium]
MRKLIAFDMVSADGFFATPDGDLSWHNVDADFNDFAIKQFNGADTLIFGRKTYDMMASYWPTPAAKQDDSAVAKRMNSFRKVVFSRTLHSASWQNAELAHGNITETSKALKAEDGKNILLFGSGTIVAQLAAVGLIDEYRLMVAPVILGDGKRLFAGLSGPLKLKLARFEQFASGNVLLCYAPVSR